MWQVWARIRALTQTFTRSIKKARSSTFWCKATEKRMPQYGSSESCSVANAGNRTESSPIDSLAMRMLCAD